MPTTAIRGGTIITPWGDLVGDVLVDANTIAAIGHPARRADREIDATGCIVSPGLVQAHVHLCQTAFSGLAEGLPVIDWLEKWVWPLERAHDAATSEASARWGVAEMLLSGTTSFLSMESAWYVDSAFEAAAEMGARATIGKAVMDRREPGTDLHAETREDAWDDVMRLLHRWHGADDDRLRLAVSPRAPSAASPGMWNDLLELATRTDLVIHTHVNENRDQAEHVSGANGMRDVEYLASLGALTRRTVLAHCVWLTDAERTLLSESGTHVAHCPVANLKLGSGIADVPALLESGVNVALGTDGAACNNTLDARREMGFAALVHRAHGGAAAIDAPAAFAMATSSGAKALGHGTRTGRLRTGMRADIAVFDTPQFTLGTGESAIDHLVYSGSAARARSVLVDGRIVVDDFTLTRADTAGVRRAGAAARQTLAARLTN